MLMDNEEYCWIWIKNDSDPSGCESKVYVYIYIHSSKIIPPKPNTQELKLLRKRKDLVSPRKPANSSFPGSACRGKMPGSLHEALNNITW